MVIAAAAAVRAEADPQLLYAGYPYGLGVPLVYHALPAIAAGCRNNEGAVVPCAYGSLPALAVAAPAEAEAPAVEAERKKREAEPVAEATAEAAADPEADPWYYYSGLYGHHLGYHGYRPFTYSYAPYTYAHRKSFYLICFFFKFPLFTLRLP